MFLYPIALARIMEAFKEYDELGKTAFLKKYDCSRSYKWVVIRKGREYPARAILASAFAKEHVHTRPPRVFPPRIDGWEYSYTFNRLGLSTKRRY